MAFSPSRGQHAAHTKHSPLITSAPPCCVVSYFISPRRCVLCSQPLGCRTHCSRSFDLAHLQAPSRCCLVSRLCALQAEASRLALLFLCGWGAHAESRWLESPEIGIVGVCICLSALLHPLLCLRLHFKNTFWESLKRLHVYCACVSNT